MDCQGSNLRLVESSTIPSLKGKFLEVQVDGTLPMCDGKSASQVLLEPRIEAFESMGLRTHESLVSVSGELVLVQNSEGTCVHLEEGMELGVVWCIRC